MQTGPFTLGKWYMDCVNDAGDAAILYGADLEWHGLRAKMVACGVLTWLVTRLDFPEWTQRFARLT
jgi:hypothetical protein